jgi:hypothetical protein
MEQNYKKKKRASPKLSIAPMNCLVPAHVDMCLLLLFLCSLPSGPRFRQSPVSSGTTRTNKEKNCEEQERTTLLFLRV